MPTPLWTPEKVRNDLAVINQRRIDRLQDAVRNALQFTHPAGDAAMWRVAAIETLPEEEREQFRDLLSRQQSRTT